MQACFLNYNFKSRNDPKVDLSLTFNFSLNVLILTQAESAAKLPLNRYQLWFIDKIFPQDAGRA
jgi:hypothetical protein